MKATARNGSTFWLVKSGERILGPFQTDEISKKIRSKEIVVIDEVSPPRTRWKYVRDVPEFASVVEEIRRGQASSIENTEIQGYTTTHISSQTATDTDTEALGMSVHEIAPPSPTPQIPSSPPASVVQEAAYVESSSVKQVTRGKDVGRSKKGLALDRPLITPAEPERKRHTAIYAGAAVLFMGIGFALWSTLKNREVQPGGTTTVTAETLGQLRSQAAGAWKRGEFEIALRLYRELDQATPSNPEIAKHLAPLMIRLEGSTVEAKRLLQDAMKNAKSNEDKQSLQLALGYAAIQSDDLTQAQEHLKLSGTNWQSFYNRGVAEYKAKNFDAAVREFKDAGNEAPALLMVVKSAIAAEDFSSGSSLRRDADSAIETAIEGANFRQEALVLGAYYDLKTGNKKRSVTRARAALDVDPEQTSDHFQDPVLALDALSWSQLLPYCDELAREFKTSTERALQSLCLGKAGRLEEASRVIESDLVRAPQDAMLHSVSAYLHYLANREDAARAAVKLAGRATNPPKLSQFVGARMCSRAGDEACAEEEWGRLASSSNPPIAAVTSLAKLRFKKGDKDSGGALLVKAQSLSPNYIPLLQLREEASTK